MNIEFSKKKIIRLCSQPRSFEFISKNLDGLDPVITKGILSDLVNENFLHKKSDLWVITDKSKQLSLSFTDIEAELYLKKYMGYFDFLKTPHPLDYEWRNSTESLNYLINVITDLNLVSDKILLLGMPTLYATAFEKDVPQNITLVERNQPITDSLKALTNGIDRFHVINADIFTVKPKSIGNYYFVMMDPPWYTYYFQQFMWLASKCVDINGIIGISLPPLNTKPDILDERIEWLNYCKTLGLVLENLYSQKLNYTMPFFEFNALRAAGVANVFPFWRKGDLAFFRKITNSNVIRPPLKKDSDHWIEKSFNFLRIRVKNEGINNNSNKINIRNLIKGDILTSVSKSNKIRQEANIMTSGNRIFRVNNTNKFILLLDEVIQNKNWQNKDGRYVKDWLDTTCQFEQSEFKDYMNWLYREMEREI